MPSAASSASIGGRGPAARSASTRWTAVSCAIRRTRSRRSCRDHVHTGVAGSAAASASTSCRRPSLGERRDAVVVGGRSGRPYGGRVVPCGRARSCPRSAWTLPMCQTRSAGVQSGHDRHRRVGAGRAGRVEQRGASRRSALEVLGVVHPDDATVRSTARRPAGSSAIDASSSRSSSWSTCSCSHSSGYGMCTAWPPSASTGRMSLRTELPTMQNRSASTPIVAQDPRVRRRRPSPGRPRCARSGGPAPTSSTLRVWWTRSPLVISTSRWSRPTSASTSGTSGQQAHRLGQHGHPGVDAAGRSPAPASCRRTTVIAACTIDSVNALTP